MMVVWARVERTLTRAWTFTPAKAEEVDMIAAILMFWFWCVRVFYGCDNGAPPGSAITLSIDGKRCFPGTLLSCRDSCRAVG